MVKEKMIHSYLKGEDLPEKQLLHEWVQSHQKLNTQPAEVYDFLNTNGKYFEGPVMTDIRHLPRPDGLQHLQCHRNSVLYLRRIKNKYPHLIEKFSFVSGLCGLYATDAVVPKEKRYAIHHHSFLLYGEQTLDLTINHFPFRYYKVDQRFGIEYPLETVVEAFHKDINFQLSKIMTPLMALMKKPFLV